MHFDQSEYDLKCEWGLEGLSALQPASDAVAIVDDLSFSTAVDTAVTNGASVLPCPWKAESAGSFATGRGAVLAQDRGAAGQYTLSRASLRRIEPGTVLALPSPNGSTLSLRVAAGPTFNACLRNARALHRWAMACGSRVAVIPAGERWSENFRGPVWKILIGAGSVLADLPGTLSPDAEMAVAAFARFRRNLSETLLRCGSGKEQVQTGFTVDVELAAEYAVRTCHEIT